MTKQQQFLLKCHEVTEFCLKHTPYCFGCWPRESVLLYVGFSAIAGCLFVKRDHGDIKGVAFAFPENYERLTSLDKQGKPTFNWSLPSEADCLMIREVMGTKQICREFWAMAQRQWPSLKRCFTYRNKPALTLVELDNRVMNRFYGFDMKGGY